MKKTRQDYIKIVLTIAIIAGLYMPYSSEMLPIDFIWDWYWDWESLFVLQLPILVVIPLLILLIFKQLLKDSFLKVLKVVFLLIYLGTLVDYGNGFYDNLDSISPELIEISISLMLSLILLILSLKYSLTKLDALEHLLLATMTLPIFYFFVYGLYDNFEDTNYGFYIINSSFIALYFISVYDIFKNRSFKKKTKST